MPKLSLWQMLVLEGILWVVAIVLFVRGQTTDGLLVVLIIEVHHL